MRMFPECFSCMLQQANAAMNAVATNMEQQFNVLRQINDYLNQVDLTISPAEVANKTNCIIRERVGIDDLYFEMKQESTAKALAGLSVLREMLELGNDHLEQGIKIAAAGNVIDVVHQEAYELWDDVARTVAQPLLGGALGDFRHALKSAEFLLILADNAGETVFDRVFIETLALPVVYAVKGGAILNDATTEDALAAGIDTVARIIETGSRGLGTILHDCSDEFLETYSIAPIVLAKGQANYETLHDAGEKVFNLIRIKCHILGREAGFPVGRLVLIH